jgi:pyruvate formate-lyase/glycerol dehydratase family glycyl radical enzyme
MISERVAQLRRQSLEAIPTISTERAVLMTAFYREHTEGLSEPVRRALSFAYLMEHKTICINPGELIVGEKGAAPKATPTYPELCCHSLQDLDILDSRPKIPFKVDAQARQVYAEEIIPFWQGKTMRERIFAEMTEEWIEAYEAGIFSEFMEQRAPGHTVLDDKIYHKGFEDFKIEIQQSLGRLDFLHDPFAYAKQEELKGMLICADALIRFAGRHAELAMQLAAIEPDPQRQSELEHIAAVCQRVPAQAPHDFWEALQYYWFIHLGVTSELNTWDSFSPGHLDHHLTPFYKRGLAEGYLTREGAEELLQCFWIKFNNQPAPPKVGVTAEESGTYTDFAQINLGGILPDGSNAVSEVTYLLLDVIEDMRLLQPSSSIQVSKKNPDRFIQRAAKIIRTGFGQPSIFNADLILQELLRMGKTLEDARLGGSSGCVEVGVFGKENFNLTGYFNLPKVLEITLNNGVDPRSGRRIGLDTGDPNKFKTFDQLFDAFEFQMNYFLDIKVRGNNVIERLFAAIMPAPFLSMLIDDCVRDGRDYHDGGARYNTSYIQGVGIGSITDTFTAIHYHIFDQHTLSMGELLAALAANFKGYEPLRQTLLHRTPKYGNDDDYADAHMQRLFEAYFRGVDGRANTKGGLYHINLLPTTCHIYFGSVTGATADGRRAWMPVSEGVSPVQGADHCGPTAVINSLGKMDHVRTGGTLLNQKLTPQLLEGEHGLERLVQLVRAYFILDGHHIQFNVVDSATLRDAKAHPEEHRNLIVRVAGYSDYFCDLSEALQNEIINRTEQRKY